MGKSFSIICLLLAGSVSSLCAADRLSVFSLQKYDEFTEKRVYWTSCTDSDKILNEIEAYQADVFAELPQYAADYEQEKLFWESAFKVERFVYVFSAEDVDLKQVRLSLKEQMKADEAFIAAHEKSGAVAPQLYVLSADVTSCYMTFSIAATLFHGMRVRNLYAKAVEKDPELWNARTGLAQWLYYAPGIFGGSNKKARENFQKAYDVSQTPYVRFYTGLYLSQYWFAKGEREKSARLFAEAEATCPKSRQIALVKKQNAKGISLFDYNRNRTGIDKNDDPNATELN